MPFTIAQESAIHARNPELLVSAAAGSGKTAVLIERIYTLLKDEGGYDIDRMLVSTFTHAAAAEMRERLETRLAEAAQTDRAMLRQAEKLETAQIGTLHSFCQKLVKEHFEIVDIDPQATLCDETVRERLKRASMEQCLDESYERAVGNEVSEGSEGDGTVELKALLQRFSQNELLELLDSLYEFLMAQPSPLEWLSACASYHYSEEDLKRGPMAETLLSDCRVLLDGALALWEDAKALTESPDCKEKYIANVREDGHLLHALYTAAEKDLSALMQEANHASFSTLASYRLTEPAEIAVRESLKELRARYKELVKSMQTRFPADAQQAIADLNTMQESLCGLAEMIRRMHTIFMEKKNERGLLDFSDLEHMALRVLSQPALQKKIAARYDAIFVDEYQDISAIQEAILNALRREVQPGGERPSTRFYVGDVKQSIYRFRQADPTLFMDKQRSFGMDEDARSRKISLNHNFRSRESVLSAVNRVFSHVMRAEVTEINYDEDAMLRAGLPSVGDEPTELHVLCTAGLKAAERPLAEAALIAAEINRRVGMPAYDRDGKEAGIVHYRDMVILLPAAKGIVSGVERTLTEAGIPVYAEDGRTSIESAEIRQALMHLRLLNNSMDDITLLAALRGPLYRMTEEELAHVRLQRPERGASFLSALEACAQSEPKLALGERCRAVLEDLAHERFLQRSMPLDEYLWSFLSRSGMYGFYGAQPGGRLRQANLRMLCTHAGEHERERGGSLSDFLDSVAATEGVRDSKSPTVLSPWEDVVRIMTIHKSKGLEFPLVFVMGLGGALNRRQNVGTVTAHPKLGVALRYVNAEARTKRMTLLGSAIALRKLAEEKAERARVLYVALTRAKDQLILVGCGDQKLSTVHQRKAAHGQAYSVWEAKSMLEWICQTLEKTDEIRVCEGADFSTAPLWETREERQFSTESTCFPQKKAEWKGVFHIDKDRSTDCEDVENAQPSNPMHQAEFRAKRLNVLLENVQCEKVSALPENAPSVYKEFAGRAFDPISTLPSLEHAPMKLGVTALVRSLAERERLPVSPPSEEEAESTQVKRLPLAASRPRLLSDLPAMPAYLRETEEQTALLRGIATHKALSQLPLAPLRDCAQRARGKTELEAELMHIIEKELVLLQMDGRMTAEECERTETQKIAGFFASRLGLRALRAERLYREWSFNLRAPELCESILQGVIDLCFLEEGAWVLVDYKTDRVQSVEELWKDYGRQVDIYRRALTAATGLPVKESVLFALWLGA